MSMRRIFASAVLAGVCIGIGGTVFLSLESKVLGAVFFTVGLFVVCTFGLHLFTGKVCYLLCQDRGYAFSMPVIWLGNLAGAWLMGMAVRASRLAPLSEKAAALSTVKLEDGLLSIFLLAVLCNGMIYIGVEGFRTNPHEAGKYLALFFGVTVFILCGFEHCVANMFYFSAAGAWSLRALGRLAVMTLGNAVGGIGFHTVRSWLRNS